MQVIDSNQFRDEIKEGVALVDFFATWCGPCKMLGPVLEDVAKDMEGKAKVLKVDVDQSRDLAMEFSISTVPTMIIFKDGKQVDTLVGFLPKERIEETIKSYL